MTGLHKAQKYLANIKGVYISIAERVTMQKTKDFVP
jgi:hypothetical protein